MATEIQKLKQKFINLFQEKKVLIAFGIIVVIAAIVLFADRASRDTNDRTGCLPGALYSTTTGEPCLGVINAEATPDEGYETALEAYAGKSISFDANCVATPATLTVKAGTKVLIANNSTALQEFGVTGKSVVLPAYRYTTSALSMAGVVPVRCGDKTAATITVE